MEREAAMVCCLSCFAKERRAALLRHAHEGRAIKRTQRTEWLQQRGERGRGHREAVGAEERGWSGDEPDDV